MSDVSAAVQAALKTAFGTKDAAPPAAATEEEKVVIRPAGATPTGVRTSASAAVAPGSTPRPAPGSASRPANLPLAGRPPAKANAKGKTSRKAASKPAKPPRRPLVERLKARAQGMRFRLLPVTIFVAVLMLGVRVGDVWRVATHEARLPDFPVTLAENKTPPAPPPAPVNGAKEAAKKDAKPPAQGGASGGPAPGAAPSDEALGPVKNEELLQHFAERRAEIERRTKEIEQREALLQAAEKRVDQKVQEMEKVRGDIQKMMRQGDEKQAAQVESLVKIYETMKPKEAARIFDELDMNVLLDVIQRMKETKTAAILASMDPSKAKAVTSALIERRGVPSGPGQ